MSLQLFWWQRITALLMAPMIMVHLATIIYATGVELTTEAILQRTQGSVAWAIFYAAFVICAAIHAAIGVCTILVENDKIKESVAAFISASFGIVLLGVGMYAVYSVYSG